MKKIELGNTGKKVSQFTLGTMLMGSKLNKDDSFAVLDDYVSRGGNFIDTANNYAWWIGSGEFCGDESENIIGQWLEKRKNRKDIFLATKVAARQKDHMAIRDPNGIPYWDDIYNHLEGASAKVIKSAVNDCLKRLKTDYIDLLYIHVDDRDTELEETLKTLNDLVKAGTVRHIGYSNIQTWRLEKIFNICEKNGWVKPVAAQLEYSYISPALYCEMHVHVHVKNDFLDWMSSKNGEISLISYSPLLKGIYGNKEKRDDLIQQAEYDSATTKERLERISRISKKLNISPNALVLAWMAAKEQAIFPILGFSSKKQYEENINVLKVKLEDDILTELNSL
jgi:aryl-alcohol dehydrogenase-like predicted oxidoreductase